MAGSTEGYTGVLYLGLLAPALTVLLAGLMIHSFIIGVNVTDWWKGRPVTPVDHIVTSLGISRMCAQCASILYISLFQFFLSSLDFYRTLAAVMIYFLFIHANLWLTSLLSVVLCLKISNFHSRLFLYLRGMILHRTVYFIAASVLLASSNSLMTLLFAITELNINLIYNITMGNTATGCTFFRYTYKAIIDLFFPLLFYCISSVLLFTSLYHHITKMKMSSNLSINLEIYYSVMKFLSFTFTYNTLYFTVLFISSLYYYVYCVSPDWLYIVLEFLPVLHSSYLIYRTPKLRSQMSKVIQNVINVLVQRKYTETRENIEVVTLSWK
ncbi:hypothetical protein GDO78_020081, partial [Eleutherodactylus coqui]